MNDGEWSSSQLERQLERLALEGGGCLCKHSCPSDPASARRAMNKTSLYNEGAVARIVLLRKISTHPILFDGKFYFLFYRNVDRLIPWRVSASLTLREQSQRLRKMSVDQIMGCPSRPKQDQ